MDTEAALEFARKWVDAWNAHDVDRVLEHFTEDAEFYSPFIVTIAKEPTGRLVGKVNTAAVAGAPVTFTCRNCCSRSGVVCTAQIGLG